MPLFLVTYRMQLAAYYTSVQCVLYCDKHCRPTYTGITGCVHSHEI